MTSETTHDGQRPPAQASSAAMTAAHTPDAESGGGGLVSLNWKTFLWPVAIYLGVHLATFYFDFALSGSYALPYITIIHSYALMLAAPLAAFLIFLRMFPKGYSYRTGRLGPPCGTARPCGTQDTALALLERYRGTS